MTSRVTVTALQNCWMVTIPHHCPATCSDDVVLEEERAIRDWLTNSISKWAVYPLNSSDHPLLNYNDVALDYSYILYNEADILLVRMRYG